MTNETEAVRAVAWYTDDHLTDSSSTTYEEVIAKRWRDKGWTVTPLYSQETIARLTGEVEKERERADKFMWQVRDTCVRAESAERPVAELEEAAKQASATLAHIYHTTPLSRALEKAAHDDYQRLDAAITGTGATK